MKLDNWNPPPLGVGRFKRPSGHINDLRPFLRKHVWVLPLVSTLIIVLSPILFPIAFLIGHWKEVKDGFFEYFGSAFSGFFITYDYYTEKNKNDRRKHNTTQN